MDFRAKHAAHRAAVRERLRRLASTTVAPVTDTFGDLEERSLANALLVFIAGSLALHLGLVGLARFTPAPAAHRPYEQTVTVEVHEPPPPPPPPIETAPPPPPPTQIARPVALAPPTAAPPPDETPPPDPVAAAPPPEASKPPRRIIGVSLESTTQGGSGPVFAVGNTRMGGGPSVAEDPNDVGKLAAQSRPPRRTREEQPDYPAALRAQNIEGEVGLDVEIIASGAVGAVRVMRSSPYDEFNRAAVASATRSAYEPALVNGAPIAQHIQFTVRFRLRR